MYVDYGIFIGECDNDLQAIKEIHSLGLKIDDLGHPTDYEEVNLKKNRDSPYELPLRDSLIQSLMTSDLKMP